MAGLTKTLIGTLPGEKDPLNGSTAPPCRKACQLPGEHWHSLFRLQVEA